MSSTVVRPPRPCAPMPSALTFSYSSRRSSSARLDGPRAIRSTMSIGSMRASFASSIAFSAVPPMPMPSMPGGHQPAPMVGTVFSTQSTMESDGLSMANLDLASEPPPFAATMMSTVLPGTMDTLTTAGVLSRVFMRLPAGSGSTAAHAFVDQVLDAHGGVVPTHVHAHLEEHGDDAGVLADRPVTLGAHARVDQDLGDGVFRRRRLLALVGGGEVPDVVDRVVVRDVLEGVCDALDEVVLL